MKLESSAANYLEVEIEGGTNDCLYFMPLQRRFRGRFDFHRDTEPLARMRTNHWPEPIPGQRIALDLGAGAGRIIEPLLSAEHRLTREKIEKKGLQIPPDEEYPGIHVPTWIFWIKRAVESGIARIIKGTLPEKIEGTPQMAFISKPQPNPYDRLAVAIEQQTAMFGKLLEKLAASK